MLRIESNRSYLRDASVARRENNGIPLCEGDFVPAGEWLIATRNFRILGGKGQDWEDPGIIVKAGQRFRLRHSGSPEEAAIWEIA